MGKSKDALERVKADAFALLAGDATDGARGNAANVLRLCGVHEVDIEQAANPFPDLDPREFPKREPTLGETLARDLAKRITALESRMTAHQRHQEDCRNVYGLAIGKRLDELEGIDANVAALVAAVNVNSGFREWADGAFRTDLGRIVEAGKATADRVERLEAEIERLEGGGPKLRVTDLGVSPSSGGVVGKGSLA